MIEGKRWSGVLTITFVLVLTSLSKLATAYAPVSFEKKGVSLSTPPTFTSVLKQHRNTMNGKSNTKLQMTPVASGAAATMAGITAGGFLGGALHAIAGPDHLAALIPRCCGQRWFKGSRIGALWGMGHGISAAILGLLAFGLKNRVSTIAGAASFMQGASSIMETAVGASLVFIGILGIKEAKEWKEDIEVSPMSLSSAAVESGVKSSHKRAVILNGILHGFSLDGAPSLVPALAVNTWRGSASFLLAYGFGTTVSMAIATTLIGESTRRAGEILERPDIPQKLSMISSILAIGVGLFWCILAMK